MIKQKTILGLFSIFVFLLGSSPQKLMERIENILYEKGEQKIVSIVNGVFDNDGNLWLSWVEHDGRPKNRRESIFSGRKHYSYWYAQKFNANGKAYFPKVELAKREIGFGISASIYLGNLNDVYAFPGLDFRIERIDSKGNHYTSSKNYNYSAENMFIDKNGIMYVYSTARGLIKLVTKFMIQEPLPIFIAEQQLPDKFDEEKYGRYYTDYPYNWFGSNLIYCHKNGKRSIAFFPLAYDEEAVSDDNQKIKVYIVSLPDLMSIDTSSFRISEALFKKIKGCKLRTQELTSRGLETRWIGVNALVEGEGDTLILYLSSRGTAEDVIYACKLTKEGVPIRTKEVVEEKVKDFNKAPVKLHKEIVFHGNALGKIGEHTGIMIYGFDKSGNVYYYVWDKSDDYWKK